jgi:hypothetical protein
MAAKELANTIFPYLAMVEDLTLCAQTFTKYVKQWRLARWLEQ